MVDGLTMVKARIKKSKKAKETKIFWKLIIIKNKIYNKKNNIDL